MPKVYSLEQPDQEKVERLNRELREHPEVKPRLTFPFPLNENRRNAMTMLESGKANLLEVLRLFNSNDFVDREAAIFLIETITDFSDSSEIPAKDLLGVISKLKEKAMDPNKDWSVCRTAIQALSHFGEPGLRVLAELSQNKNWAVRDTAIQLINSLKQKNQNKEKSDKENQNKKKDLHSWLLASQKPLFAAPNTPEVISRIEKLQKISEDLKEKYKEKFIGFVLLGSTNKGYVEPASDLDWGIIAQDRAMSDDFKEMAIEKGLLPCFEHYVGVDKNYQVSDNQSIMFYGLFFGDHDKLLELQRQYLESIDQPTWDKIRKKIFDNETKIGKAQERFSLSHEETRKMEVALSLLRVPPSYQETLEILRERSKSR